MARRPLPLSEQERVFIERYAATGDGAYSAEKAGYAFPAQRASMNLAKPRIAEAIEAERIRRMTDEIMPAAMAKHLELLQPGAPAGPAIQAVKLAYDQYGQLTGASNGKELHEMTLAEIQAAYKATQHAMDNARLVVDLDAAEEPFFE